MGIIEYIQNKCKDPLQNPDSNERKKALDSLDEEIKSLSNKNSKN